MNNGLEINTWTDDIRDISLVDLCGILKDMYSIKVKDVKDVVKKINEEVFSRIKKGMPNWYSNIDVKKFV